MDSLDKVRALIKANPAHLATATGEFERLHRAAPNDDGIRRVYFALQAEFNTRYPIRHYIPDEVEPPEEAWKDDEHPFWKTDPYTVWQAKYSALATEVGHTAACMRIYNTKGMPEDTPGTAQP